MLDALTAGDTVAILDHCQALTNLGADWISFWRELMLAFRDRLETETRQDPSPQKMLRSARILQLLLHRERDLRDSSLPQVVVELALLTAAQLPHLAPLDGLLGGTAPAPVARPSSQPAVTPNRPAPPVPSAQNTAARPTQPIPPSPSIPPSPPTLNPMPPMQANASEPPGKTAQSSAPVSKPGAAGALRSGVSDVLKASPGGLPRTLASLSNLAAELRWDAPVLRWCFPGNMRDAVQELERERTNPHLLEALASLLPGLASLDISFQEATPERPEDQLRREPAFQALLQASGGEILEVKRVSPR
jgi:DNA polymerase-3 subunit gamma/tau